MASAANEQTVAGSSASGQRPVIATPDRVKELLRLAAVDDADLDIVRAALWARPDDVALLLNARAELETRFGSEVGLDLVPDEDHDQGRDPTVGVFVRLGTQTDIARRTFDAFCREWWLPRMRTADHGMALDCVWR